MKQARRKSMTMSQAPGAGSSAAPPPAPFTGQQHAPPLSKGKGKEVDPMKANRTYGFFTRLNTTTFKKTIAENPRLSSGQGAYEDPLTLLDDNIIDESDGTKPGAVFLPSSPALLDYICNSATLLSGELKRWSANKPRRWLTRKFEVSGHYLYYYQNKNNDDIDIKQIDLNRAQHTYQSGSKIIINFGETEVRLKASSETIAAHWVSGLQSAMQCTLQLDEQSKLLALASSDWIPMQSSESAFNQICQAMGMGPIWAWVRVPGVAPEDIELVPRPCVAVLLRTTYTHEAQKMHAMLIKQEDEEAHFGHTHTAGAGAEGAGGANGNGDEVEPFFFMRQLTQSAAAIVAVIHALSNNAHHEPVDTICLPGSPLARWIDRLGRKSAGERGLALADAEELREVCNTAVATMAAASGGSKPKPKYQRQQSTRTKQEERSPVKGPAQLARSSSMGTFLGLGEKTLDDVEQELEQIGDENEHDREKNQGQGGAALQAPGTGQTQPGVMHDSDYSCFLANTNPAGVETLYELDGVKAAPVDLGPLLMNKEAGDASAADAELLETVAEEVSERQLAFSVSEIEHCTPPEHVLLALVKISEPKVFC